MAMSDRLLYIGAGWDIRPLLSHNDLRSYKEYILVDPLPEEGMDNHPFSKDKESLYCSICDEFGFGASGGINAYPWVWSMKGYGKIFKHNRVFKYFYNTKDVDIGWLTGDYDVFISGYAPRLPSDVNVCKLWISNSTVLSTQYVESINYVDMDRIRRISCYDEDEITYSEISFYDEDDVVESESD